MVSCLINQKSFFDRIVLSIDGTPREDELAAVEITRNFPVGGPKRMFARCKSGVCSYTQNPFDFLYGRSPNFPRAPKQMLSLRSEAAPLTAAQVSLVLEALMEEVKEVHLSLVEFTCDTTRYDIDQFRRHVVTRARSVFELSDSRGWTTIYCGTRRSDWQSKVYQKSENVVRFELTLKNSFLRKNGILKMHDLLMLSGLDIWALVCFRELDRRRFARFVREKFSGWRREHWLALPDRIPLHQLVWRLRQVFGPDVKELLRMTKLETLLRKMQGRLIW